MTSSLVGSEMCIRDRSRLRSLTVALSRQLRLPPSCPSPRTLRRTICPRPVSYTHLTLPTICSV
eukprot:5403272-Prorocentrum_lima.AAC.1